MIPAAIVQLARERAGVRTAVCVAAIALVSSATYAFVEVLDVEVLAAHDLVRFVVASGILTLGALLVHVGHCVPASPRGKPPRRRS